MRADVREQTRAAAAAELEHNGTHLVLVSEPLAEMLLEDWSEPVQFRAELGSDGLLEITVRELEDEA